MTITGLLRSRRMGAHDRRRVLEAVARFSIPAGRPLDIRDIVAQASRLLYLDVPLGLWRMPRNALGVPAYLIGDGDSGVPVAIGVAKADLDGHTKFDVLHEVGHLVLGHAVDPQPLPAPADAASATPRCEPDQQQTPHLGPELRMLLTRGHCPGQFGDARVEGETDLFALTALQRARPADAGARPAEMGLPGLISSLGGDIP